MSKRAETERRKTGKTATEGIDKKIQRQRQRQVRRKRRQMGQRQRNRGIAEREEKQRGQKLRIGRQQGHCKSEQ